MSTFLGANTGPLYPSLGSERCYCCSILCVPADDEGRCSTCVTRDAWPCPDCNVHVYADERHEGGRCEECHAAEERSAA